MADCECLPKCPFFHDKMENMPSMADMMKTRYCHDAYQTCARYRVFKAHGREAVPTDLFPNQAEAADQLLASV
jgi:hypothetical protein